MMLKEKMVCEHHWQHCKFVKNNSLEFTVAFYCKKCLEFKVVIFPPIKEMDEYAGEYADETHYRAKKPEKKGVDESANAPNYLS